MADFSKGNGYTKKDLVENGTPIVLYGRLYTKYETVINDVNTFVEIKEKSVLSEGNEVVVPASGESSKDISRASVVGKSGFILGGDLNIIKLKQGIYPIFLALTISNGSQQKEMSKRAQGKSVVHLHNYDLKQIDLLYPKFHEQQKIGQFFQLLDQLINLQKRKVVLLEKFKKGYLQQLFTIKNEVVPYLRFLGFNSLWRHRKLGEVLKERNEQIPENEQYQLMSFVKEIGVVPKGERYDRSALVLTENKKYKKTEFGDFIYSSNNLETGSIGFNKLGKAIISPVYSIFYSVNEKESQFVGLLSTRREFISKMIKYRQGVVYGQWKIHESDFLKIDIRIPSKEEQGKIIDFFSKLDTTITSQQSNLNKLIIFKKYYLQKMFI